MEKKRSYRRSVAEHRVLALIVDRLHLLLYRLSDILAGMNHLPSLDELLGYVSGSPLLSVMEKTIRIS